MSLLLRVPSRSFSLTWSPDPSLCSQPVLNPFLLQITTRVIYPHVDNEHHSPPFSQPMSSVIGVRMHLHCSLSHPKPSWSDFLCDLAHAIPCGLIPIHFPQTSLSAEQYSLTPGFPNTTDCYKPPHAQPISQNASVSPPWLSMFCSFFTTQFKPHFSQEVFGIPVSKPDAPFPSALGPQVPLW